MANQLTPLEVLKLYPEHDYTLCGAFDSRLALAGDRPFIVFKEESWSRGRFREAMLATARMLCARGIKKGDRIGVLARNDIGHVLLLFACARIGAVMVPTNPEYGVQEAGYVLKHAGVSAVACSEQALPVVREACQAMQPTPWLMLFDGQADDAPNFFDLIAAAGGRALPAAGA